MIPLFNITSKSNYTFYYLNVMEKDIYSNDLHYFSDMHDRH